MFKRVSSHLQSLATPFLSDITGQVNNLIGNSSAVTGSQAKVAAQLLKKSPFENLDSPMEALKRDPLGFSQVQYPLDLTSNELGHYILFYTLANDYEGSVGNKASKDLDVAARVGLATYNTDFGPPDIKSLRQNSTPEPKMDNSVYSKFPTHTRVTSAIALYMPPGVKVSYQNSYEAEATDLFGTIGKAMGEAKSATSMADQLKAIAKGAGVGVAQFGKDFLGEASSALGAGDPFKMLAKSVGTAVNPQQEQFYVGPQFRGFSYTFDFWPRNQAELEAANNIIFLFKYHSHPSLEQANSLGRMFFVPSEFEIHYLHMGKQNQYLNKISKCVCTGVDVEYGPEGEFKTFVANGKGAPPVHYKMTVTFTELQLMTKQKIYEGY